MTGGKHVSDYLSIRGSKIKGRFAVFVSDVDDDGRVIYVVPSLDMMGDCPAEEVDEYLQEQLDIHFEYWIENDCLIHNLRSNGWESRTTAKLKRKRYSHPKVDPNVIAKQYGVAGFKEQRALAI